MSALKQFLQANIAAIAGLFLLAANHPVMAGTDFDARESYLKARAQTHESAMPDNHSNHIEKSRDFHGVFYGFLPCSDCNGIKVTLSLKQNNLYLLVSQPARESSREFYEKGKYTWNEETHTVELIPRDNKILPRQYFIQDEGTLVQLNEEGKVIPKNLAKNYTLQRSDTAKSREVHIH